MIVIERNSGVRSIKGHGGFVTVLEAIATSFRSVQVGCAKLVGNYMIYAYSTNLVLDDEKKWWTDDRTMSRVIV